jgi:hypothetical protein
MKNTTVDNGNNRSSNLQESETARENVTYESALRDVGIDEACVARKLKDLLKAKEQRWNPKKESWEKFEDYRTQLAALREIAKISGFYAKDPDDDGADERVIIHLGSLMPKEFRDPKYERPTATGDGREHRERSAVTGAMTDAKKNL